MIYILSNQESNMSQIKDVLRVNDFEVSDLDYNQTAHEKIQTNDIILIDLDRRNPVGFKHLNKFMRSDNRPNLVVFGDRDDFLEDSDSLLTNKSTILLRPYKTKHLVMSLRKLSRAH